MMDCREGRRRKENRLKSPLFYKGGSSDTRSCVRLQWW